jgi:hypothetical protein
MNSLYLLVGYVSKILPLDFWFDFGLFYRLWIILTETREFILFAAVPAAETQLFYCDRVRGILSGQ